MYIDIKPDNFMIKVTNNVEKLYFIDFGLMEKFMSVMSAGHREMQHRNVVAGTAQFVSVDVQNGSVPSRKDDIEAMVCMNSIVVHICIVLSEVTIDDVAGLPTSIAHLELQSTMGVSEE